MKIPSTLLAVAAERHGVVSSAEAREVLTRSAVSRRIEAGQLIRFRRGALVVADQRDELTAVAALQLVIPDLVAERRTAGAIWGLDGCSALARADLDLVHPSRLRSLGTAVRTAAIPARAITTCRGVRVTTPAWTLLELGCAPGVTVDHVELALESALHRALTTEGRLRAAASEGPNATLREALGRRRPGAPPTESYAETKFLQTIVRPLGLEDPERQVRVLRYRMDFVFRRERALNVEIDGGEYHGTPAGHERDTWRDHLVRREGYEVVRFAAARVSGSPTATRDALMTELCAVG